MRKAIKPPSEWLKLLCKEWAIENTVLVETADAKFLDYKPYLKGLLTSQLLCRLSIPPAKDPMDGSHLSRLTFGRFSELVIRLIVPTLLLRYVHCCRPTSLEGLWPVIDLLSCFVTSRSSDSVLCTASAPHPWMIQSSAETCRIQLQLPQLLPPVSVFRPTEVLSPCHPTWIPPQPLQQRPRPRLQQLI